MILTFAAKVDAAVPMDPRRIYAMVRKQNAIFFHLKKFALPRWAHAGRGQTRELPSGREELIAGWNGCLHGCACFGKHTRTRYTARIML